MDVEKSHESHKPVENQPLMLYERFCERGRCMGSNPRLTGC